MERTTEPRARNGMNSEKQIKSLQRVEDHGEVFTPSATVEAMLDQVKDETERIDSKFLEPACGSGNFLVPVLQRKLLTVAERYGQSEFEKRNYSLLATMSIYGIEILKDNIEECKNNLMTALMKFVDDDDEGTLSKAAAAVLSINLIHGDALKMKTSQGEDIVFSEWGYLGKGKFQRREFLFGTLTLSSTFSAEDSLFSLLGRHELFTPLKTYQPLRMSEIAELQTE